MANRRRKGTALVQRERCKSTSRERGAGALILMSVVRALKGSKRLSAQRGEVCDACNDDSPCGCSRHGGRERQLRDPRLSQRREAIESIEGGPAGKRIASAHEMAERGETAERLGDEGDGVVIQVEYFQPGQRGERLDRVPSR